MSLKIEHLHVTVDEQEILKGVSLEVEKDQVIALMGPNGSGKSTLAHVLMGHPAYNVTKGKIILDGEDITEMPPDERARKGLFLSFQYPKEIPGVSMANFLRTAANSMRDDPIPVLEFKKQLDDQMMQLQIDPAFQKRNVNEGFSGGEKKRAEILQMAMLNPKYAILDETDSGLDIDALRTVAEGINKLKQGKGIIIITHYQRILDYIKPDKVIIMRDGMIVKHGGKELVAELEKHGYAVLE